MTNNQIEKEADAIRKLPREQLDDVERKLLEDHDRAKMLIQAAKQKINVLEAQIDTLVAEMNHHVGVRDYTIGLAVFHHRKKSEPTPVAVAS